MARVVVDESTGCWLWQGALLDGYGKVRVGQRIRAVHVVMYELDVGPVPPGLELDHVRERGCVHRHCCNPAHMEPVTRGENLRRRPRVDRCKRGHPFDEANTRIGKRGDRHCRACDRARHREWRNQ